MNKPAWKYGLISGAIILVYSAIALYMLGDPSLAGQAQFDLFQSLGYLRYLILLVFLYLAMRSFRNQTPEPPTFRPLMRTGVLVTLVAALMAGLLEGVYLVLNPGFYEHYMVAYISRLKTSGAPEVEIRQLEDSLKQAGFMKTPLANGMYYFLEMAFIGNIASLAFAMLMRKRDAG